ncbi:hypothetical protein HY989_01000 [Candidatus Micrarchaeota archaeon]|nr:hypothetical protein [Candidatus Micrarchaeota archaeon]
MEFVVKTDKSGRLVLPKAARDEMKSNTFILNVEKDRLVFKRVPTVDEMWGAFPNIDMEKHRREHAKER